jgi:hypothetical protein
MRGCLEEVAQEAETGHAQCLTQIPQIFLLRGFWAAYAARFRSPPSLKLPLRGSLVGGRQPQGRERHRSDIGLTAFIRPRPSLSLVLTTVQPPRGFVMGYPMPFLE